MRPLMTAFACALTGTLGLLLPPAGGASAAALPLGGFYQAVTDVAHGHVFVSPGSGGDAVVVTNMAGTEVAAIGGQDSASGMALSPDGSTLYVALAGSHAVSAFSTASLTRGATYPLAAGENPAGLAVANGKLWVSYYDVSGSHGPGGYIGEIDPATSTFTPEALPGSWYSAPQIAVDPLGGGTLVAADSGLSTDSVGSYDVATAPPTVYSAPTGVPSCGYENDIAVLPGGTRFLMACNEETGLREYSTATLALVSSVYASGAAPNAVTVAPDGAVAEGTGQGTTDVLVYKPGGTTPVNAYRLGGTDNELAARGLAWSADGSRLVAAVRSSAATPYIYTVHAFSDPAVTASTLSLGGTSTAVLGKSVTLVGELALSVGTPPAGTTVTITRTAADGAAGRQFTVPVAAGGTFTLTDRPTALGSYTYTARYAGGASSQPATAARTVTITRFPVALTLGASASTVDYPGRVTVTAHLGRTYTARTVSIYAQSFGGHSARVLLKTGRVDARGELSVSYTPYHSTAFSAVFAGDARYAPETVTRDVYVRAVVSASVSGYYASTDIGGTLYRVFHHTATLRLAISVSPDKAGECVQAQVQIYYQGAWYSDVSAGCGYLNKSSRAYGTFSLSKAAGYRYRIQAEYVRSATDTANLGNHSGWRYFEVVQ